MEFYESITSNGGRSPLRKVSGNEKANNNTNNNQSPPSPSSAKRHKATHPPQPQETRNDTPPPVAPVEEEEKEDTFIPLTMIDMPENLPSRRQVQIVYETAAGTEDQTTEMTDAGLLSLQTVLLPAIAQEEFQTLKKLQAKLQRPDGHPQQAQQLQVCRKFAYDCVGDALQAVAKSRNERLVLDQQREEKWIQEKELQMQRAKEEATKELARQKEEAERARIQRKHELVKKWPRNQALWREVVYLMTEMSKLEKEERMWKEARENLEKRAAEFATVEQQTNKTTAASPPQQQQQDEEATTSEEMQKLTQTMDEIAVSSTRIHQALDVVSEIASESDRVRKDLYRRYRRDHQFHGYQGIKDPKGLLRSLSQSQDMIE